MYAISTPANWFPHLAWAGQVVKGGAEIAAGAQIANECFSANFHTKFLVLKYLIQKFSVRFCTF